MFDQYHDLLIDMIKDHFNDKLSTVSAYFPAVGDDSDGYWHEVETPAALVEVEMLHGISDLGDGRDAILCDVSIHCVLSTMTNNLQRELWNFAVEMARLVKKNPAGVCEGIAAAPTDIIAVPGRFEGGKVGYDSRVVSFSQNVAIGKEAWSGVGIDGNPVIFKGLV